MKRITAVLATFAALALSAVAIAAIAVTGPAQVKLRKTSIGKILVNRSGFTLYVFSRDTRNSDHCIKIKSCPSIWPPLKTVGKPIAGPGVKASLLGRIKLPNGKSQVTYGGHPLYRYSGDTSPGETAYVGTLQSGGRWYAINASGKQVK